MVPRTQNTVSNEHRNGRGRRGNPTLDQPIYDPATNHDLPALQLTTKAGKPRQRMQWTDQLNTDLVRCYYKVTEGETISVGIRPLLQRAFVEIHPDLAHLSEQRLIDQKRVIINNGRLSRELLEALKNEASHPIEPREDHNIQAATPAEAAQPDPDTPPSPDPIVQNQDSGNNTQLEKVMSCFIGAKQKCSRQLAIVVNLLNTAILPQYLEEHNNFNELHTALYAAAITAIRMNKWDVRNHSDTNYTTEHVRPWERRLNNKITKLRKDIGQLTAYIQGQRNCKLTKKTSNRLFQNNEKQFYRRLRNVTNNDSGKPPSKRQAREFWESIWSVPTTHNVEAPWIQKEIDRMKELRPMDETIISPELLRHIMENSFNWKAAGNDRIHNF
ncbi:uncharacterized protein LOC126742838 [Anthonomus grandis grandis]|uniref:uncharacterized protein LOC126742838 n=1 Tax=Anthonomus grandis grandis TaxID=2921223 RepID=UPI00216555DD|nr:uncharacterized protein LOC126742838 [Anthonomus grandis grandis]